ncbi:hypothetical protein JCM10207_004497 [Rhodosporidiobolus poonsookiae]
MYHRTARRALINSAAKRGVSAPAWKHDRSRSNGSASTSSIGHTLPFPVFPSDPGTDPLADQSPTASPSRYRPSRIGTSLLASSSSYAPTSSSALTSSPHVPATSSAHSASSGGPSSYPAITSSSGGSTLYPPSTTSSGAPSSGTPVPSPFSSSSQPAHSSPLAPRRHVRGTVRPTNAPAVAQKHGLLPAEADELRRAEEALRKRGGASANLLLSLLVEQLRTQLATEAQLVRQANQSPSPELARGLSWHRGQLGQTRRDLAAELSAVAESEDGPRDATSAVEGTAEGGPSRDRGEAVLERSSGDGSRGGSGAE